MADPIATEDLQRYARRLDLSDEQRRAVDEFHDRYRARQRELREGPIERFLQEHPNHGGYSSVIDPDPAAPRRIVQQLRDLQSRVRSLDDAFFDQVQTILTEPQIARLPAVREVRARQRHRAAAARLAYNPVVRLELGEALLDVALTEHQRSQVEAHLPPYETRLTRALRDLDWTVVEMELTLSARLAESGADPSDFRLAAALWREAQEDLARRCADIAELHRALYARLRAILTLEQMDPMRSDYLGRGYPKIPVDRGEADRAFRRVLDFEALPAEVRMAVDDERRQYLAAIDRLDDRMLDVIDAQRASSSAHALKIIAGDDDRDYYEDESIYEDERRRLLARRGPINAEAVAALEALLDARFPGRIALRGADEPTSDEDEPLPGISHAVSVTGDGPAVHTLSGIDPVRLRRQFTPEVTDGSRFLPAAITSREFEHIIARLAVDEPEADTLRILHEEYVAAWHDARQTGPGQVVRELERTLFVTDDAGRPVVPDESAVTRLFEARQAALASLLALDDALFDDMRVVLGEERAGPTLERLRAARRRAVYVRANPVGGRSPFDIGGGRRGWQRGTEHPTVNLSDLVDELDLRGRARSGADEILLEYERQAADRLRAYFETRLAIKREEALMIVRHLELDEDGVLRAANMIESDRQIELDERRAALRAELINLNHTTRDAVAAMLDEAKAAALTAAYKRAAWPEVYRDGQSILPALEAALALDDLPTNQRSAVYELMLEHRRDYETLCDRIIEAGSDWSARQRFSFERDELSRRAARRLRSLLSDDQVRRIGGLPG